MNGIPEPQMCEDVQSASPIISTAREIPLTQEKVAIVDLEDYDAINKYCWFANRRGNYWYAIHSLSGGHCFQMHRLILKLKDGDGTIVDHINRNGLDNRKINLRITTRTINRYNCKMRSNNTSGYRGVNKQGNQWRSKIGFQGRRICCGIYNNPMSAAMAYDKAAIKYYGPDAILNFPERSPQ